MLLHASVLRRLKKKFHPRIVQHLWILEQEDYIFYASKFEGRINLISTTCYAYKESIGSLYNIKAVIIDKYFVKSDH